MPISITNNTSLIEQYILQLSIQEQKILNIAQDHLQSSFDITKSIGYLEWLKTINTS